MTKAVKIVVLDEVAPLAEIEETLPFDDTSLRFEDETGAVNVYENTALKSNDYTIFLNVKNDALYDKLKTIKHDTFIRFQNYYTEGGNWGKTLPEHARGYLPLVANMAYLYSSDKFKEKFFAYPYNLYDDSGNLINRQAVYESFFKVKYQYLGVVEKVEGLGGGSAFGIHSRFLAKENDFYVKGQTWSREVWAHEYGHVIGFGHGSNMTYRNGTTKKGYVDIVIDLYEEMLASGELPFPKSPYVQ